MWQSHKKTKARYLQNNLLTHLADLSIRISFYSFQISSSLMILLWLLMCKTITFCKSGSLGFLHYGFLYGYLLARSYSSEVNPKGAALRSNYAYIICSWHCL